MSAGMRSDGSALTCRRCESERVALVETYEEHATWDQVFVTPEGTLVARAKATFSPGDLIGLRGQCDACGHEWSPRRRFVGPEENL